MENTIYAAMFAAIGNQTKLSRNGCSIVFVRPQCGRHDLSSIYDHAMAQASAAGLDLTDVTDDQIAAYQHWYDHMYNERRISQARILVTRKYAIQCGHQLVPHNRVDLIDGWGNVVESAVIPCREYYDANALNRLHQPGAYCSAPDYSKIDRIVAGMQQGEYHAARVQDNNKMERRS